MAQRRGNRAGRYFGAAAVGLLACATLWFIFSRSAADAGTSSGQSLRIAGIVQRLMDPKGRRPMEFWEPVVRKAAHFGEFAVLGLEFALLAVWLRRDRVNVFFPLFCTLASAVTDETIQRFFEGRSPQVTDVVLDFSGAAAAIAFVLILYALTARRTRE